MDNSFISILIICCALGLGFSEYLDHTERREAKRYEHELQMQDCGVTFPADSLLVYNGLTYKLQ